MNATNSMTSHELRSLVGGKPANRESVPIGLSTVDAIRQKTQVEMQEGYLAGTISDLEGEVEGLDQMLRRYLRPDAPTPKDAVDEEALVDHAYSLRTLNHKLTDLRLRLASIRLRLEC